MVACSRMFAVVLVNSTRYLIFCLVELNGSLRMSGMIRGGGLDGDK